MNTGRGLDTACVNRLVDAAAVNRTTVLLLLFGDIDVLSLAVKLLCLHLLTFCRYRNNTVFINIGLLVTEFL